MEQQEQKAESQTEKVDDLELSSEQAGVVQAGTENAETGEIRARFRYQGSAG